MTIDDANQSPDNILNSPYAIVSENDVHASPPFVLLFSISEVLTSSLFHQNNTVLPPPQQVIIRITNRLYYSLPCHLGQ